MEKRISSFSIISIFICIITVYLIVVSGIVINNRHQEKLMHSMESNVEYYAKRCYLENKCEGVVTIKDLYDREYLEEVVNPITKEIVDENTQIDYKDGNVTINWPK